MTHSEVVRVIQEELDAVPGPDAPPLADRIAIALGAADLLWRASEQPSASLESVNADLCRLNDEMLSLRAAAERDAAIAIDNARNCIARALHDLRAAVPPTEPQSAGAVYPAHRPRNQNAGSLAVEAVADEAAGRPNEPTQQSSKTLLQRCEDWFAAYMHDRESYAEATLLLAAIRNGAADELSELAKLREALEWYATATRVVSPHPKYQRYYGWCDDGHYARVVLGKEKPIIIVSDRS